MNAAAFVAKCERMKILMPVLAVGFLFLSGDIHAEELVIIGNPSYPMDYVTRDVVQDIYLGKKTTEGAVRIHPINQKDPVIRKKFLEKVVGMTADSYNSYWIKKIFQDGAVPPVVKPTSREVIETILSASPVSSVATKSSQEAMEQVKQHSGVFGYVWKQELTGVDGIKVLMIVDVGDRR